MWPKPITKLLIINEIQYAINEKNYGLKRQFPFSMSLRVGL